MCIDSYLKLASECEDTLEQNTFKSFKTAMENEIIKNLHFTANAFFTDNLNDSDDE